MKLSRRLCRAWHFWFPHFGLPALRRLELIGHKGNQLDLATATKVSGRIEISAGLNNVVTMGADSNFNGVILIRGAGNTVTIGPNCVFGGRITIKGNNQRVDIGENTTCASVAILAQEGCSVSIGANCMFSREIEIRTSDSHSVVDRTTGKRINPPQSISIGDHVWIGLRGIVSKGAQIPDDAIVGAGAFVNKPFTESGIMLVGTPAVIARRNVTWQRTRKRRFKRDELD